MSKDKLSPQKELFCLEYVKTGNATAAYRAAYNCKNKTAPWICVNACKLKNETKVALRIEELEEERRKKYNPDIIKGELIETYADIFRHDVTQMFKEDEETGKMKMKSILEFPKELRCAIKDIGTKDGRLSVRFHDKVDAGRELARLLGLNEPEKTDVNISGNKGIDVRIVD